MAYFLYDCIDMLILMDCNKLCKVNVQKPRIGANELRSKIFVPTIRLCFTSSQKRLPSFLVLRRISPLYINHKR